MKRSEFQKATYEGAMLIAAHMLAAHMTVSGHDASGVRETNVVRIAKIADDIAVELMLANSMLVSETEEDTGLIDDETAQGTLSQAAQDALRYVEYMQAANLRDERIMGFDEWFATQAGDADK